MDQTFDDASWEDAKKIGRVIHNRRRIRSDIGQISVNNIDAMLQLCSEGMGLATPPAFLVEKLVNRGSLIEVLADWQVESIPVYAVWPGNSVRNRIAQKFVELVSDLN